VDVEKLTQKFKDYQNFKVSEQADIDRKHASTEVTDDQIGSVFKVYKSQLGMVKLRQKLKGDSYGIKLNKLFKPSQLVNHERAKAMQFPNLDPTY
jgi:hypothetical protein